MNAEALQRYLMIASKHSYNATIANLNLQSWLEHATISNKDELQKICNNIVYRESWRKLILRF